MVEEDADQVIAHFPPLSYLLTSDAHPLYLRQTLAEALPADIDDRQEAVAEIEATIASLEERKNARMARRLSVVNFVNILQIERWLKLGGIGRFSLSAKEWRNASWRRDWKSNI